jgi:hypothetical protein
MQKIFKFSLPHSGIKAVSLPVGAKILSVHEQANTPLFWALVDPKAKCEDRTFAVYQNGEEIRETEGTSKEYLGTIHLFQGEYVIHVFELHQKIKP